MTVPQTGSSTQVSAPAKRVGAPDNAGSRLRAGHRGQEGGTARASGGALTGVSGGSRLEPGWAPVRRLELPQDETRSADDVLEWLSHVGASRAIVTNCQNRRGELDSFWR